jgi:hypothetical protein
MYMDGYVKYIYVCMYVCMYVKGKVFQLQALSELEGG